MSDSSCSNCDKECRYRDYTYDCYQNSIISIQKHLTEEDIRKIKDIIEILDDAFEEDCEVDELNMASNRLKNIIDLYEGE